jgi:hypothetical protein
MRGSSRRDVSVDDQKRVLLAAIRECADVRNPVSVQDVGKKLWPRRDDDDPELLALIDALLADGALEPWPRAGHVKLPH